MSKPKTPTSAMPDFYYAVFRYYEAFLGVVGSAGAFVDPKRTHELQGPWPNNVPPTGPLPKPTALVIYQLCNVSLLLALVNFFFFGQVRSRFRSDLALQEKIAYSLMIPLFIGDFMHMGISLWAWGDDRWDVRKWSFLLWTVMIAGMSLLIPRACWMLGIGRYVHKRDGVVEKNE